MSERDHPNVAAPPPLIFLLFLIAGLAVHFRVGGFDMGLARPLRFGLAALLFMGGAALLIGAIGRFRAAGTNPEPWRPATALVASGVYRVSRNPMYVGMALVYAAIATAFDCLLTLALLVPALIVMHYGVVRREERYLEAKFGDAYRAFKAKTRRWI